MNYIEALTAMSEGKKVTNHYMPDDGYVCFDESGQLASNYSFNPKDYCCAIEFLKEDCWEIYNEPIINDTEFDVLFNTLLWYKKSIQFVEKRHWGKTPNGDYECLCIHTIDEDDVFAEADTYLPPFKAGTMYKGMELNKEYTLEELGLFE